MTMPAGRPTKLDQVVLHTKGGTPVLAGQQVVDRVQLGMTITAAADSAGVDRSTVHRWRLAGARLRASVAQGKLPAPDKDEHDLIEFCNALERAEAEAEAQRLAVIQLAAQGGQTIVKVTEKRDADGLLVESTTITETARPEWTAAAWWLERRRGYVKRYDLTVTPGELVPPDEAARDLADSLREYLVGVEDGTAEARAKAIPVKSTRTRKG